MTSAQVYESARYFNNNHDHKFENVFVHAWEADLFSVTSSGYCYELEVKISRSDFFADFKKPKHHFFKSYKKGYGILKKGLSWVSIKGIRSEYNVIEACKCDGYKMPNRFYYVVPDKLISAMEIPPYAGLIYSIDEQPYFKVIIKAPYLHKEIFDYRKMLFDKYRYGYENALTEIKVLKRSIKSLTEKN